MNNVNYRALCHKLEAHIDSALTHLSRIPGEQVQDVRQLLLTALLEAEEEIIKEGNNVLLFPFRYDS